MNGAGAQQPPVAQAASLSLWQALPRRSRPAADSSLCRVSSTAAAAVGASPVGVSPAAVVTPAPGAFTPIASQAGIVNSAAPKVISAGGLQAISTIAAAGSSGTSGVGAGAGVAAGIGAGVGAGVGIGAGAAAGAAPQESLRPLPSSIETTETSLQPLPTGSVNGVSQSGGAAAAQQTQQTVPASGAAGIRLDASLAMLVGAAGLVATLLM